jgi:DNA excision repair protein ERCC-6
MERYAENGTLHSATIYTQPPADGNESQQDSGDEDGTDLYNHLSGNQLNTEAEADITHFDETHLLTETFCIPADDTPHDDMPSPSISRPRKWTKKEMPNIFYEPTSKANTYYGNDPVEFFEMFFDEEIISFLIECTTKYAHQNGNHTFSIDDGSMKAFISILLLSGYNDLPRRRLFWENSPDVINSAVADAMPRKRFDTILQYFKVCDNAQLPLNDRFGKVRVFCAMLNERWLNFYPRETHLSIDEAMIPYFGRHGAKQHLHGKPIRFGFKVWCLCTRLGYLIQCEPYQGAATGKTHPSLGVGGSVVLDLLAEIPDDLKLVIYMDNYFTSLKLIDELSKKGYGVVGTIRSNRIEKAPLTNTKLFSREERGRHECLYDVLNGITLCQWHDNNVVTLASNCYSSQPLTKAKRWSNKEKKYIEISQPDLVARYNTNMGGVDRLDQNISSYRIGIRKKKWWFGIFSWLLSASVNNGWQLYREATGKQILKKCFLC